MSVDLQSRIQEYATWVESGQEPVTLEEIIGRSDDAIPLARPIASTGRALRGPWPALVAAAVVLVIFGVFMWVFPSDQPVPPADSVPPPWEQETVYYTTSAVPDGFVLQDVRTNGDSSVWYLREFDDEWLPTDGGFAIRGIEGHPAGVPADPNGYLDATMDAVPGSTEIEVAGRRGIIFETVLDQGEVRAPLIWILGIDDGGGVFEVATAGMTREQAMSLVAGVGRVSAEDLLDLGLGLGWDVKIGTGHNDFVYATPQRIIDLADEVDIALGMDLLHSRLAGAGQESTVITTQDGEIVDTFGQAIRSTSVDHFLELGDRDVDDAMRAYPAAEVSRTRREAAFDEYIAGVRGGPVLSEEPYVIQADESPEPRFDVARLGVEVPLEPVESAEAVPDFDQLGFFNQGPLATENRPVIVIGATERSELDLPPVVLMLWFTESGEICEGASDGDGMGIGCGFLPLGRLGLSGGSSMEDEDGNVRGEVTYNVPLETSVVQAIAGSETFWQRPIGGYGLFPYGGDIPQTTAVVAYDADGNEIGRWPA